MGNDDGLWQPSPAARRKERHKLQKPPPAQSATASRTQQRRSSASPTPAKPASATKAWHAASGSRVSTEDAPSLQHPHLPEAASNSLLSNHWPDLKQGQDSPAARQNPSPAQSQSLRDRESTGRMALDSARGMARPGGWEAAAVLEAASPADFSSNTQSDESSARSPAPWGASASTAMPSGSDATPATSPWSSPGLRAERERWKPPVDSEQVLSHFGALDLEEREAQPPEYQPSRVEPLSWNTSSGRQPLEGPVSLAGPLQRPRPPLVHHLPPPPYLRAESFHNPHSSVFSGCYSPVLLLPRPLALKSTSVHPLKNDNLGSDKKSKLLQRVTFPYVMPAQAHETAMSDNLPSSHS